MFLPRLYLHTAVCADDEMRLRGLPLCTVRISFTGDHAFTQQHFRAPHRTFLGEIIVLYHQYFANQRRVV